MLGPLSYDAARTDSPTSNGISAPETPSSSDVGSLRESVGFEGASAGAVPRASAFVENVGQFGDPSVAFVFEAPGYHAVFRTSSLEVVYSAPRDGTVFSGTPAWPGHRSTPLPRVTEPPPSFRIEFAGSEARRPTGEDPLAYLSNYFQGPDSSRWHVGVRSYQQVIYQDLYPGVDLAYGSAVRGVKYEFRVAPQARLSAIELEYQGIETLAPTETGGLQISEGGLTWRDDPIVAYDSRGNDVRCNFSIRGSRSVGFDCPGWDGLSGLVIDPLLYSTYVGGAGGDAAYAVEIGPTGDIYLAGYTTSGDFPNTTNAFNRTFGGGYDIFVVRLNANGTQVAFATYIGGSGDDIPYDLKVDKTGAAYLVGATNSPEFPTTPGAYDATLDTPLNRDDVFALKMDANGSSLSYSTFIGGAWTDVGLALALDDNGDAIIAGKTFSDDFPVTTGAYDTAFNASLTATERTDAFLLRLNATGQSLVSSTFLGGEEGEGASSVAIASDGSILVSGGTDSADFPTSPNAFARSGSGGPESWTTADAFLCQFDSTLSSLLYSTYLGGSGDDAAAVGLAEDGAVMLWGETNSTDFPTTPNASDRSFGGLLDGFVARFNLSASRFDYSTYVGGSDFDSVSSLKTDSSGAALATGVTLSSDFPVPAGAPDPSFNGRWDAFMVMINTSGDRVLYGTFLGGPWLDWGADVAMDSNGNAVIAGFAGSGFPATPNAFDNNSGGGQDAFVAVVSPTFVVSISGDHAGFNLTVDGVGFATPLNLTCRAGSILNLTIPPLDDPGNGTRYAFANWSNNSERSLTIMCDGDRALYARFVWEYLWNFESSPSNMTILLDGVSLTTPAAAWCINGTSAILGVPEETISVDENTRLSFVSWSDGGAANHSISCTGPANYTAGFVALLKVRILSNPPGPEIKIDGQAGPGNTTFFWAVGSNHTLDAPPIVPFGNATRLRFAGWSDGGAASHSIVIIAPLDLIVSFTREFLVSIVTSPSNLTLRVDGAVLSPTDGQWWEENSSHTIGPITPQSQGPGFRYAFVQWADGAAANRSLTVREPVRMVAEFIAEYELTVTTSPRGLNMLIDGTQRVSPVSFWRQGGSVVTVEGLTQPSGPGGRYVFARWQDGGVGA